MAIATAKAVTAADPANKAKIPYCGRTNDVGCQFTLAKNSAKFKPPNNTSRYLAKNEKEDGYDKKDCASNHINELLIQ